MKTLITLIVLLSAMAGCDNLQPADPIYVQSNRARLQAVGPRLGKYEVDHPDDKQATDDIIASWRLEVEAQARHQAAATQPVK